MCNTESAEDELLTVIQTCRYSCITLVAKIHIQTSAKSKRCSMSKYLYVCVCVWVFLFIFFFYYYFVLVIILANHLLYVAFTCNKLRNEALKCGLKYLIQKLFSRKIVNAFLLTHARTHAHSFCMCLNSHFIAIKTVN